MIIQQRQQRKKPPQKQTKPAQRFIGCDADGRIAHNVLRTPQFILTNRKLRLQNLFIFNLLVGAVFSYVFDHIIIWIRIRSSFLKSCIRLILNKHLPYAFPEKLAVIKQYVQAHKHTSKHRAIVDISQICNAKCYYCPSGFSNRERDTERRGEERRGERHSSISNCLSGCSSI